MAEARFIMQNRRPNFSVYQTLPQFFKKSFSEIFRGIGMHIPRNICIALSKTNLYADAFDNSWAKTHRLNWCLYILRAEHLLPDLGLPFPHGSKTPWMHGKNILYWLVSWLEQIERGPSFKHRVQGFLPCLQKNIRWRRSPRFLSRIHRLYTCCNFTFLKILLDYFLDEYSPLGNWLYDAEHASAWWRRSIYVSSIRRSIIRLEPDSWRAWSKTINTKRISNWRWWRRGWLLMRNIN